MSNVIRPTVWEDRALADLIDFIASIDPATVEMVVPVTHRAGRG